MYHLRPKTIKARSVPPAEERPATQTSKPESAQDEKRIIRELEQKHSTLKEGETWYLISKRWMSLWKEYVDTALYLSDPPPPIDNSELLVHQFGPGNEERQLKKDLSEMLDFHLYPEAVWMNLHQWYGGGPAIARKVIRSANGDAVVEIYPWTIRVRRDPIQAASMKSIQTSRAVTVGEFLKKICDEFGEPEVKGILKLGGLRLQDLDLTLEEAGFESQCTAVFDPNPPDKMDVDDSASTSADRTRSPRPGVSSPTPPLRVSSPSATKSPSPGTTLISNGPATSHSSYHSFGSYGAPGAVQRGLTGLSNLGNTCFMNSALQCLSNTTELTEYFLSDRWLAEINKTNPLGMQGHIAEQYGALVKLLWSGKFSYVEPRDFKYTISKYVPQFSGYHQHDSQELLSFLLDGLHEDLNRILQRPYVETVDGDGTNDSQVAAKAWAGHKQRNDSVIVDLFQAQLKSTLVCPDCGKVSVTFDPYLYLSLPLPAKSDRVINVTMQFADPSRKPVKYAVSAPKKGVMADLKKELSIMCGVKQELMAVAELYQHRLFRTFNEASPLDGIQELDVIWAYELTSKCDAASGRVMVPIIQKIVPSSSPSSSSSSSASSTSPCVGHPFIIDLPRTLTTQELYDALTTHLRRVVDFSRFDEAEGGSNQREDSMETDDREPTGKERGKGGGGMFTLATTNTYGTQIYGEYLLGDGTESVTLKERQFLSIRWSERAYRECYSEEKAKECELHASMSLVWEESQPVSLDGCFRLYTTQETLGAGDEWYCPQCKAHKQASKQLQLWSLPSILVVHLKRFSYTKYSRDRIDTLVHFPISGLDLNPHLARVGVAPQPLYDLFAVSNHYGSLGGGHYTACCNSTDDKCWYSFDDSHVSSMSQDSVVTSAAYVLFYRRRKQVSAADSQPQ